VTLPEDSHVQIAEVGEAQRGRTGPEGPVPEGYVFDLKTEAAVAVPHSRGFSFHIHEAENVRAAAK
jgi:hypothetical protein